MASKDGKIFDTIVYIGLSVNALAATYLNLSGKSGGVKGKTPLF